MRSAYSTRKEFVLLYYLSGKSMRMQGVRKCLRSCLRLEVGRCGHDNLWANDQALCDYTDGSREQKPNGVRRQNALTLLLVVVGGGPNRPPG